MKDGIKLRIGEQWAVLPDDMSISIEMASPVWNESGTFSYSFPLPYTANSSIFNQAELPESDVRLNNFREKFELYVDGVCLLNGDIVCDSEEIDIESDSIDVELRSDLAVFDDAIKDANLQDLEFDFYVGRREGGTSDSDFFYFHHHDKARYGDNPFINVPILTNSKRTKKVKEDVVSEREYPMILHAMRNFPSPCFFLLYIYDRILSYAGFRITNDDPLKHIEDLKRIIVMNVKCDLRTAPSDDEIPSNKMYLTSKNLPDMPMSDFIDILKNTFGLRLVPDGIYGLRSVLLRDLLKSNETYEFSLSDILSVNRKHVPFSGIEVKYATDEGNEYSYADYNKVRVYDTYKEIVNRYNELNNTVDGYGNIAADSDTTLYISKETGNYYRVKVDKNTNTGASLFEVGQFLPYRVEADKGNKDEEPEEMELNFQPMIPTPVKKDFWTVAYDEGEQLPNEAFFVDAKVEWTWKRDYTYKKTKKIELPEIELVFSDEDEREYMYTGKGGYGRSWNLLKCICEAEVPFTLGILRDSSTGEQGDYVTIVRPNVDGFGNDEWASTASYNSVTSDSVTHDGKVYDYNGSGEGLGAELQGLVSLKLWNCKQNFDPSCLDYKDKNQELHPGEEIYNNRPTGILPNRGIVPQFLSEYLYFCQHRRLIVIEVYMEVSELINVKWEKYHRIAGYRCLLNKISFDVTHGGIGVVTIEAYMI